MSENHNIPSVFQVVCSSSEYSSDSIYSAPTIVTGSGTSFVIRNTGYKLVLMTNAHVVENAVQIQCFSPAHALLPIEATLLSFCFFRDLALIEIDIGKQKSWLASTLRTLKPFIFRTGLNIETGEAVVMLGYPLGLRNVQAVPGFISGKSSNDQPPTGLDDAYIIRQYVQLTNPVNPGNSGGPVVNNAGEVIGVASASIKSISWIRYTSTCDSGSTSGNDNNVIPHDAISWHMYVPNTKWYSNHENPRKFHILPTRGHH